MSAIRPGLPQIVPQPADAGRARSAQAAAFFRAALNQNGMSQAAAPQPAPAPAAQAPAADARTRDNARSRERETR